MKVVIFGSRNFTDIRLIITAICHQQKFLLSDITEIISGGAKGIDSLAEQFAKENFIKFKEFPADWDMYGKSAGYKRNEEMAKYADYGIAIWDGQSKGTEHMIRLMKKRCFVYYPNLAIPRGMER